jgi:hypothetical protein
MTASVEKKMGQLSLPLFIRWCEASRRLLDHRQTGEFS